MNARIKASLLFQAPEPPQRDLTASLNDREQGARREFAKWREAHPNFEHKELMDNWHRIRVAWNISKPDKKKTRK